MEFCDHKLDPEAGNEMFGRDPRDIHLGFALVGMNPYSEKRNTQSFNFSDCVQLQTYLRGW